MFSLARLTLIACLFLMCATAVCAQGDMYRPPNKKAGSERRPPAAVATALTNDSILSLVRGRSYRTRSLFARCGQHNVALMFRQRQSLTSNSRV